MLLSPYVAHIVAMGVERSRHGRSSHIQSLPPISLFMKLLNLLIPALIAIVTAAAPVDAREKRSGEQDDVYKGTQGGAVKSLRSIENSVVPGMKSQGADYIGQEYDGDLNRYRLKFLKGKSVIWVDVDGRTGAIIGRAGG
jgi:hypothetical protein